MRLAIADPPYPPQFAERRDRPDGPVRHKPNGQRGSGRVAAQNEAVILYAAEGRRARTGPGPLGQVPDLLIAPVTSGFAGAKPAAWTRWVLDALTYDPATDTVADLFPGSGAVTNAAGQGVLL